MSDLHPEEVSQTLKPRVGTRFNVSFPDMPSLIQKPYEAELIQKRGSHDVLRLMFKQTSKEHADDIPTGLAVRFRWEQLRTVSEWFGYVSYVASSARANQDGEMEIVCVGTSFPLKEKVTRVFEDCSIPEAVQIIAKENGLEFVGDLSARKFPQLIIAGQSYWEWIQEQANRLGYLAFMDGVTLTFRPLDSLISAYTGSSPIFSLNNASVGLDAQNWMDRTLTTFKVLRGDYIEMDGAPKATVNTGGVNPLTGEAFTSLETLENQQATRSSVSPALFTSYRTDQVVMSSKDSDEAAKNLAQLNRFKLPAKLTGLGDSRCRPNTMVLVEGVGTTFDGYWLVKDVTHSFNMYGQYTVSMLVLSDGTGSATIQGFDHSNTSGRNVVNIAEKLAAATTLNSTRAMEKPKLSASVLPITAKDLSYVTSTSRWGA